MDRFSDAAIWILSAVVVATAGATLVYREHLRSDAHWITQTLCEDKPVLTGRYKNCLEHYAPAEPD